MNVIRKHLEYYLLQLCGFVSGILSITALEAIKNQIMDESTGRVSGLHEISYGTSNALLHKKIGHLYDAF